MASSSKSLDKRQRRRSILIATMLAGMAVMFFVLTIFKMGGHVLNRPL